MSFLKFNKVSEPSSPAANKGRDFFDTLDLRRKFKDYNGVVHVFSPRDLPNLLINGDFTFIQRAAAALTNITGPSITNRIYSADRWGFTSGNVTTPQFQQVDTSGAPETGITARYYARFKQFR